METKVCTKCLSLKDYSMFFKDKQTKTGLRSWCKNCLKERNLKKTKITPIVNLLCEIWKDIPNYEGYYQASNLGRIKSLDRTVNCKWGDKMIRGKLLSSVKNKDGYLKTVLCKKSKTINFSVHRLVAESFIPNPNNLPQINHINGIKTDNKVENLEWCTAKENTIHSYKNNLQVAISGQDVYNSKLKKEDVLEIRKVGKTKKLIELANTYDVSISCISHVLLNKTYKNVK